MKIEVSVPEVVSLFKVIQTQPDQLFEIIHADLRQSVGQYLSEMMQVELSQFLGREPYERTEAESNHRNGSYHRQFTLKGIGAVEQWRNRDLSQERIKYLFVDGVNFDMRMGDTIEKV